MPQIQRRKTTLILMVFLMISFLGYISCNLKCADVICAPCPESSSVTKPIYFYDTNFVHREDLERFYVYNYEGKNLIFIDSMDNYYMEKDRWEFISLNTLRIRPSEVHNQNRNWIVTLKDSSFPVSIGAAAYIYEKGNGGCCSCGDKLIDSISINHEFYKSIDLPVKID